MMNPTYYTQEWQETGRAEKLDVEPFAFFRDDDVGFEDEHFVRLANYFITMGTALNIAVIPNQIRGMSPEALALAQNRLFYATQHGFDHQARYTSESGDRGEFHPSLSDENNLQRIQNGWKLFEEVFKGTVKGFVPPWHSFPKIDLLLKEKYKVISGYGDKIELIEGRIISAPTNIDLVCDYEEKRILDKEELLRMCAWSIEQHDYVGILVHHNFLGQGYERTLDEISDFLQKNRIPIKRLDHLVKER